jgi:Tol biopolymer transport system component
MDDMKTVSILGWITLLTITGAAWSQPGINVSQVTHSGQAYAGVALTPDGKQLAYVYQEHDRNGCAVWLHDTGSGSGGTPDRQMHAFKEPIELPVFSPDAKSLWYLTRDRPGLNHLQRWSLAAGPDPKSAVQDVDTQVSFAPDGKTLAFIRWVPGALSRLILLPLSGAGKPQELQTFPGRPTAVAWSPDGSEIAVAARKFERNKVMFVSVKKGTTREILAPGIIGALSWSKTTLFATMRKADQPGPHQVWSCSMPGGAWKQITHDDGGYVRESLSASADGSLVAAARYVRFQTGLEDLAAWVGNKDGGPRVNPDVVLIRPGK